MEAPSNGERIVPNKRITPRVERSFSCQPVAAFLQHGAVWSLPLHSCGVQIELLAPTRPNKHIANRNYHRYVSAESDFCLIHSPPSAQTSYLQVFLFPHSVLKSLQLADRYWNHRTFLRLRYIHFILQIILPDNGVISKVVASLSCPRTRDLTRSV